MIIDFFQTTDHSTNFSFIGISQSILATSYVKWIDVWMIFTMVVSFLEVGILIFPISSLM